jgi:hypothetical protein
LPSDYAEWKLMRAEHVLNNLLRSNFTYDLYRQYKKHLGNVRYQILVQVQLLLVPERVRQLLAFQSTSWLMPVLRLYKLCRIVKMEGFLKEALLPAAYKKQIAALDSH